MIFFIFFGGGRVLDLWGGFVSGLGFFVLSAKYLLRGLKNGGN